MTSGPNLVTHSQARARQAYRRQLRKKLCALIDLADEQFRARQFADFEQTRAAIRLTLGDLGSNARGMTERRVAERLPASPSTRHRGAEE